MAPKSETIALVPNKPKTPNRTVRLDDEIWERLRADADAAGESISDVIRRAVTERATGGAWVTFYHDNNNVGVYATELEALRAAHGSSRVVVFVPWGKTIDEAKER